MDEVDYANGHRIDLPLRKSWRSSSILTLLSLILAIPIAILAGAAAEVIVAVGAVITASIVTRDIYVVVTAPSYGPYAAATILQNLLVATSIWAIGWSIATVASQSQGIVRGWIAAIIGGIGSLISIPVTMILVSASPLIRSYSPIMTSTILLPIVMLGSVIAGYITPWILRSRYIQPHLHTDRHFILAGITAYAFITAVLLESVVAITSAMGLL